MHLMNITYFELKGTSLQLGDYCYGSRWSTQLM